MLNHFDGIIGLIVLRANLTIELMERNTNKVILPTDKDLERAELLLYILTQMTQSERPNQPPKISKTPFGPLVLFDNSYNSNKVVLHRLLHGGSILTNNESVILNEKKVPPLTGNVVERNHYLQIVRNMKEVGLLNVAGKVAKLNVSLLAAAAEAILRDSKDYPYQTIEQDRRLMHGYEKARRMENRIDKTDAGRAEKIGKIIAKYTGH